MSAGGELLYVFRPDFQQRITARSLALRLEPALAAAGQVASYVARVSFGTALITSIAVVYLALTTLAASNSRDDRNRRSGPAFNLYISPFDVLW